jgi:hypothetical protein
VFLHFYEITIWYFGKTYLYSDSAIRCLLGGWRIRELIEKYPLFSPNGLGKKRIREKGIATFLNFSIPRGSWN